jgi:4a-hydroxytetrahydrobiopterin dehydratase
MVMALLTSKEISAGLVRLPDWQLAGTAIRKQYRFAEFLAGIRFVERVAAVAEAADHHPDIDIRYTRITMTLSTHSAGGLTEKDFALAAAIDQLPQT